LQARPITAFPTPCQAPNGLQWSAEGLWVVDQILDDAYLLSPTGKVLRKLATVCENVSGVTFGGGHLWLASNGATVARPYRPTDTHKGAVPAEGPAPHWLSIRNGVLWYCDANFAGKNKTETRPEGPEIGWLEK
jgi:sugar lactone lactonase YvrE